MTSSIPVHIDHSKSAARYMRMSTDHQRYSIDNQAIAIDAYAEQRGISIVRTYTDEGKSGLTMAGRDGLKSLITDILTGQAPFGVLLVYDVSRWGRFQDADESAYYEFICRRAGVQVRYCAESFENDGSATAAIMKSIKRAMAGEYSRELSVKVFAGQCRLIERGYRQGGQPGIGLRRLLLDPQGMPKAVLATGEFKNLHDDRIVLVPGPAEERAIIEKIYGHFLDEGLSVSAIVRLLNAEGVPTVHGRPWTRDAVREVLTNEKYIGNNVYNRTSRKLKAKPVRNPSHLWVRADGAFPSVVDIERFERVKLRLKPRPPRRSSEALIEDLVRLHQRLGRISRPLIQSEPGMATLDAYRRRFGSLTNAYKLAGLEKRAPSDEDVIARLAGLYAREGRLSDRLIRHAPELGSAVAIRRRFGSLPNAYKLAGYDPAPVTNDQMLSDLVSLHRQLGKVTFRAVNEARGIASVPTYCRRFGTLENACRLAGLELTSLTNKQMLEDLACLQRTVGEVRARHLNGRHGVACATTYKKRFGSLENGYRLAGLS